MANVSAGDFVYRNMFYKLKILNLVPPNRESHQYIVTSRTRVSSHCVFVYFQGWMRAMQK